MEEESTPGKTAENMKVNTTMTANMVLASTPGKMAANTKANGTTESNMETVSTASLQVKNVKAIGSKAKEKTGWTKPPHEKSKIIAREIVVKHISFRNIL